MASLETLNVSGLLYKRTTNVKLSGKGKSLKKIVCFSNENITGLVELYLDGVELETSAQQPKMVLKDDSSNPTHIDLSNLPISKTHIQQIVTYTELISLNLGGKDY